MADFAQGLILKDPSPDTYLKWKIFKYPDENAAAGKTAFAMSTRSSDNFIAGYTLLLTAIFFIAWDIILCLIIFLCAPKKMSRSTYSTLVAIWNSGDPFSAGFMMLRPAWSMFWELIGTAIKSFVRMVKPKPSALQGPQSPPQNQNDPPPDEVSWGALWFNFVILVFGLGTFAANLALGVVFPNLLIIGNGAPVNPKSVLFPSFATFYSETPNVQALLLQYESVGTLRALGGVEGAESSIRGRVRFETTPRTGPDWDKLSEELYREIVTENRYDIHYSYTVNGVEMGLQHLGPLEIAVNGTCKFADKWYNRTTPYNDITAERYNQWVDAEDYPGFNYSEMQVYYDFGDTGIQVPRRSPPFAFFRDANFPESNRDYYTTGESWYEIFPSTAARWSLSMSNDPWYATQRNPDPISIAWLSRDYETKRGRPPLACTQVDQWSYGSWKNNTLANLLRMEGTSPEDWAPVIIPEGIKVILKDKFAFPLIIRLGISYAVGTLKSAAITLQPDYILDAASSSAEKDIERMVLASYLATKDTFRDAGLAGSSDRLRVLHNELFKDDGNALPGTGDFILRSSQVKTMRLGWVIAFPTTFLILLCIAGVIKYGRNNWSFTGEQSGFRWVSQFILLTTGLSASQLYRTIDQILIEQAIQYDDTHPNHKRGISDNNYPVWDRQGSTIAYVSTEDIKTPLPVTEVQIHVANSDTKPQYRLTLGLSSEARRKPAPGDLGPRYPWTHWDGQTPDNSIHFSDLAEQGDVIFQGRLGDLSAAAAPGADTPDPEKLKGPEVQERPLSAADTVVSDSIDRIGKKLG